MDREGAAHTPCPRCGALLECVSEAGQLYLWFPLGHSLGKVSQYLHQQAFVCDRVPEQQLLIVECDRTLFGDLVSNLSALLTQAELKDTKALFLANRQAPELKDFARVTSLQEFVTLNQAGWLLKMLAGERLTSHFQPIVCGSDPTQVFAYQMLLRGIDPQEQFISPGKILSVAKNANLLFQVDLAARQSAIREASRFQLPYPIFINFTPAAIYDPSYCLRSTVKAIDEVGIAHDRVVFEITESERIEDVAHLKTIVNYYRTAGFRVALDDIGSGYSSLNLVHQLRPDFIKLDMELIRGVNEDPYKALVAEKILEIAQSLDILTIAEGIETLGELAWVRSHQASYVQGYLIAKPASPPPVVAAALA